MMVFLMLSAKTGELKVHFCIILCPFLVIVEMLYEVEATHKLG